MRIGFLVLCLHAASGLIPSISRSHGHAIGLACRPLQRTFLRLTLDDDGDDFDELDALDTTSSWDEELAEFQAWEKRKNADVAMESGTGVDEDAHYDLGGEDDEDTAQRMLRQIAEKQQAAMMQAAEAASPSPDKAVLTSLEAVINMLSQLTAKVDALSTKIDQLEAAATAPTAASPASGKTSAPEPPATKSAKEESWDGEVDEAAWFDEDDDDDDMPDWRDVRRLNQLSASPPATAPAPSAPSAPPPAKQEEEDKEGASWDGQVDEVAYFDDDDDDMPDWRDVRRLNKLL